MDFDGVRALERVDLAVEQGELVGLIGPNGAGKTTLVNVVSGFQRPSSGRVTLNRLEVTGWHPDRLARAGLGRSFQGARLFSALSVLENVEVAGLSSGLGGRGAAQRARVLLARFGLEEVADERAALLPHGSERLLGIARALALRPRILLLDEPAAGLDERESRELVSTLARIRDEFEVGLVVIEHDMSVIMSLCERIQVLDHGHTIALGAPQEIQGDQAVLDAYLGRSREGHVAAD